MNLTEPSDPYNYSEFPLNDIRSIDPAVRNIYALFGKHTTVIPIRTGNNTSHHSWAVTTFEQSNKPAHQAELRKASLAVQCGKESNNLYGIKFDRQADYELFVQSNPKLRESLAVASVVGVIVFLRMTDPMPPSFRFGACAWLAEGQGIPVYSRENPGAIKILSRHLTVEVRFSEVSWNEELMLGFRRYRAEGTYGAPFSKTNRGNWIVNPMFWAEWFHLTTSISYHASAHQFLWRNKDGSFKLLSDIAVAQALFGFHCSVARELPAWTACPKAASRNVWEP